LRFGDWVWGSKSHPEYESLADFCLSHNSFPFGILLQYECSTQLLAKVMGVILIAAACMIKTPIIRNVCHAQSAAGLSRTALYGETIVYANSAVYGYLRHLPWTAYGEYMALVLQSMTIVLLTWHFSGDAAMARVATREKIMALAVAFAYIVVATRMLPESKYYWLTSSSLPILLYARGSQILNTYHNKHTGAQSIVSVSMSLWGASTRVLTTLQEIGFDVGLMMPFFLGLTLNSMVFTQYFLYYDNTQKVLEDLRLEKEQKKKA